MEATGTGRWQWIREIVFFRNDHGCAAPSQGGVVLWTLSLLFCGYVFIHNFLHTTIENIFNIIKRLDF